MSEREYTELDSGEYYKTPTSRGVVSVSEEKTSKTKVVGLRKEIKSKDKWVPRRGSSFGILYIHIHKIIDLLFGFSKKFGWPEPTSLNEVSKLKKSLSEQTIQKNEALEYVKQLEKEIKTYKENIQNKRIEIIRNNLEKFETDLAELENKLNQAIENKIKEEEIQKFLKEHPWFFSPEYISVEPKKPAGSKSEFDFYLEDFKGQGTIVELKLPSEQIFSSEEKYGVSKKTGEALGQLIRYIETTTAISHSSELKKIEEFDETKPIGFIIIGRTQSEEDRERLKVVNHYFHKSIQIFSYDTLLNRAKTFLEPWQK